MLKRFALGLTLCGIIAGASAQSGTVIHVNEGGSAYLQDSRGVIVRSQNGLCWRGGYWTPADAVAGCDGALVPPIAKPIAPDIVPPVATQATPTVIAPPPAKRCDFSVTLDSDQTFAFNKAILKSTAKKRIDNDVLNKVNNCSKIENITITGHTDRLGSQQYNQKLSEKRANAVAAYLRNKGISANVDTLGAGKTQPIKSCPNKLSRTKLLECLAPNRRVTIEVRGMGNK